MSAAEHLQPVPELEDLDTFLEGDEPDWDADPEEAAPVVGDVDQVNRMLRRLDRLDRRADELMSQANNEIARIQLWLTLQLDPIATQRAWLEQSLAQYHRARLARDPKAKTISLPAGTLKSTAQQPEWEYEPALFVAWAAKHAPALVRYPPPSDPPPAPDKAAVKKAVTLPEGKPGDVVRPVTADGLVVEGVHVLYREPKFVIDLEGGDS